MSSRCAVGRKRRSGQWKRPVSHYLARCGRRRTGPPQRQWPVFQSRQFRQACRDYRLQQEFITPYTPEQNGIIERFFRSLKEGCVWQQTFQTFEEARRIIRDCMQWYNCGRPHQALGYRIPVQYRAQQATQVA